MNEKLSKEEKEEALTFISLILPIVGLIMSIYYLVKKEKNFALKCFLWALVGMGINAVIKFIFDGFGQRRPLIDLSIFGNYSPTLLSAVFAFIFYDFVDWIKPIWFGWGALVTSVLYVLVPLLHINHIEKFLAIPLILAFYFVCVELKRTKLKGWQSWLIAALAMLVWAFILSMITGLIYDL